MSVVPAKNAKAASKIETKMMLVTPTMAAKWLAENNTNNRPINPRHVDKLSDDMENGRFLVTHQGIGFNCDGTLLDGQHRLAAIVQSKTSQNMLVSTGLSKESPAAIDDHQKRSVSHSLQVVHGVTMPNMSRAVAAAGWLQSGAESFRHRSRRELEANFLLHQEAIAWAIDKFPTSVRGLCRAQVLAVVARAYYTEPRTKVAHACEVLMDSSKAAPGGADGWMLKLRDWLMTAGQVGKGGGNWSNAAEVYKKVQSAFRKHLDGVTCTSTARLQIVSEDVFPLPAALR